MHLLVTGGAGYVGSVVANGLFGAGHTVTILDNLQQGHEEAVPKEARFIQAGKTFGSKLCDAPTLREAKRLCEEDYIKRR